MHSDFRYSPIYKISPHILGVVKVGNKLSNVEFFFQNYALAGNFRLSQSKPPNFDYPQMHK